MEKEMYGCFQDIYAEISEATKKFCYRFLADEIADIVETYLQENSSLDSNKLSNEIYIKFPLIFDKLNYELQEAYRLHSDEDYFMKKIKGENK